MTRALDIATLDAAAKTWAGHFDLPSRFSKHDPKRAIGGREWGLQSLYDADFRDEFEHLLAKFRRRLGPDALAEFEIEAKDRFTPRDDEVFDRLLAEKLAIDRNGIHIPGKIGSVILDARPVGRRLTRHGTRQASWNLYAGEAEERALGHVRVAGKDGPGADPLPPPDMLWPNETDHLGQPSVLMALNTNVSIAFAIAGLDPASALLDEGSAGAVIQIRSDSVGQPVDPDAVITGVNLATLTCSTTAFGAAGDDSPGALATAAAITDDSSADATGTADHFRASSSNASDTPLNDHIDGECGTSGADMNLNTLAFVSGAIISILSWLLTQPQGPTAT